MRRKIRSEQEILKNRLLGNLKLFRLSAIITRDEENRPFGRNLCFFFIRLVASRVHESSIVINVPILRMYLHAAFNVRTADGVILAPPIV